MMQDKFYHSVLHMLHFIWRCLKYRESASNLFVMQCAELMDYISQQPLQFPVLCPEKAREGTTEDSSSKQGLCEGGHLIGRERVRVTVQS